MSEPKHRLADDEAATRIYSDMPNYVGNEAELLAAIEIGMADIAAGRTVAFEAVAAEFRRNDSSE